MNIHIFHDKMFIDDFISKVNEYGTSKNSYYCINKKPFKKIRHNHKQVKSINVFNKSFINYCESLGKTDTIVIHYLNKQLIEFLNSLNNKCKIAWIFWGADYYKYKSLKSLLEPLTYKAIRHYSVKYEFLYKLPGYRRLEMYYRDIKLHFQNYAFSRAIKKIDFLYHYNQHDFADISKNYTQSMSQRYFMYPRIYDSNSIQLFTNKSTEVNNPHTKVLVGNSAHYYGNHLDLIELLPKREDIIYYLSASYGSNYYKSLIINRFKSTFRENCIPITDFMTKENFYTFLNKMDVGVFNNIRPLGMGTITCMLSLGKNIYMNNKSTSFHFLKDAGFKINPVEEVAMINPSDNYHKINRELSRGKFEGDFLNNIYKNLF